VRSVRETVTLGGLFGFRDGAEKAEKGVDAGDFEGVEDAFVHGDQGERASAFAVADVGADQGADAGGIDIGDAAEVDDEKAVFLGPQNGLKLEQGGENNGAVQTESALAGLGTSDILDGKGFLRYRRHPVILAFRAGGEYYRNVNFADGRGAKRELGRLKAEGWFRARPGSRTLIVLRMSSTSPVLHPPGALPFPRPLWEGGDFSQQFVPDAGPRRPHQDESYNQRSEEAGWL
jgi:hypothetical protein